VDEIENEGKDFDDIEDDEDEDYTEKEHDRHNLQPDCEDVISDFKERTKGIKIELYKKNTMDFDKESDDRRKKKKKNNKDKTCPSSERVFQKVNYNVKSPKTKKT